MTHKPKVLVVCTGNSMRSQIAEGVLRADLGHLIEVYSAGTHPSFVHPQAIAVLREAGIDVSALRSKSVTEFLGQVMDLVITVCDSARETCPHFPHARKTRHQSYPDPLHAASADDLAAMMRDLRDQMRRELRALVVQELDLADASAV